MKKEKLDAIARVYDPTSPKNDFDYWLLTYDFEVLKNFLIGDVVIELGCGRGVITSKLAKIVKRKLIVVEGSQENIEFTRKIVKNENVEFYHCLWQEFEFKEKVSDVVFFSGLEHLSEEDGRLVLENIKKWLDEHSRLHVIVPNVQSLHRRIAWYANFVNRLDEFSERDKILGHKTLYTKERLFNLLNDADYKIIHWEGILLKPFPNHVMLKLSLSEKEIEGLYKVGKELPEYCAHIYVCCKLAQDKQFKDK
jgi:SAM-dependent methyltransferase